MTSPIAAVTGVGRGQNLQRHDHMNHKSTPRARFQQNSGCLLTVTPASHGRAWGRKHCCSAAALAQCGRKSRRPLGWPGLVQVNDMEIVTDLMSKNSNSMQVTLWTPSKSGSWAQELCPALPERGHRNTVALARLAALVWSTDHLKFKFTDDDMISVHPSPT